MTWRTSSSEMKDISQSIWVAVEAGHHQKLLEDLGGLGQRVEGASVDATRDQIIAGPFRCALREEGRFHLDEAVLDQIGPRFRRGLAPEQQILLDGGTPQVQVAVFQADVFGDLRLGVEEEGGRLRLVQDLEVVDHDLDVSGFQVGVLHAFRAGPNQTPDGEHVFAPDAVRLTVDVRTDLRVEDDLDESFAVAKIDEDDPAMIPAPVRPSHQHNGTPVVRGRQCPTVMGPFGLGDEFRQVFDLSQAIFRGRSRKGRPGEGSPEDCSACRATAPRPRRSRDPPGSGYRGSSACSRAASGF